ncbi:Helix-turn-helix type 11 domain protein [Desulfonatronospira thiodismutans ASO3-1]|uniref:Helix-turn-helix type 11 domain protein n=1 Tax=Desulfonatronospira thiodismutans ASO3-1 TaxID=555779 RepID=D6SMZ0_9BACT|nr:Helix-turn-helix type 11 domain protein [Desulfonatronospira thiodismutans ASO3-1]
MRGRNIIQLLRAVDLLGRPGGITINQMSEALEVDRRSVYRLLDIIQELGFPIYDENDQPGREKSWKLDADYVLKLPNINLPDIRFTLPEIMALYFLRAESRVYRGTEIENRLESAYAKLNRFVPGGLDDQLSKLKTLFVTTGKLTKDYSGKESLIDSLTRAMLRKRTCVVSYFSFMDDTTKKFRIDPLYFFENNGGLYLFVRVTRFGDIRVLAVERIEHLEELEQEFEYPQDFDPEEKLGQAFDIVYDDPVDLEVWFSADQAKYIKERRFSCLQTSQEHPDGSITLKMKTSGWFDVKKWIMGFGSSAVVLKPEEMRNEIREETRAVLARYDEY